MPEYSDTSPYDCPKTNQILEDAWKVLEKKFVAIPGDRRSGRGGIIEAMALVASGKPEHRELVRKWVRSKNSPWRPPTKKIGEVFEPGYRGHKGFLTWQYGYTGLYCALYYEATRDEFVLPALRKYAIEAAMGQSSHGTWGHTFSFPSFNGGKLHRMCPGYGALNAAGNRCYFLITLAQKLGIEHPEIDAAVKRSTQFFSSYVDQGAIPYGDHGAAATDDSNGKNTGAAYSLKLLGDKHGAKYFSMMSSHCSFTRRGGHGHGLPRQLVVLGSESMRPRSARPSPNATCVGGGLYVDNTMVALSIIRLPINVYQKAGAIPPLPLVMTYSIPFKQLLITGKDSDESLYPNKREVDQLMASARPQLNDEWLIENRVHLGASAAPMSFLIYWIFLNPKHADRSRPN